MGVSQVRAPRRTALVAEETREMILRAAEVEFAQRGFASARLEDIAERVGITRAAVIYHFGDKQALYDAVLEATFGSLTQRIRDALNPNSSHAERVERLVDTYIEFAAQRPTLGKLFLREVADSQEAFRPEIKRLLDPMFDLVLQGIEAGQRSGAFRPIDANHFITILAGATMWYATNAPLLDRKQPSSQSNEQRLVAYRELLMDMTRFLLGIETEKKNDE